jgi:hypothetical protein
MWFQIRPLLCGVVPVFAPGGALHGDADIRLGDRSAVLAERDARRPVGWIDTQDIAGGAVQPDVTKVAGLKDMVFVEKEPQGIGRVITLRLAIGKKSLATWPSIIATIGGIRAVLWPKSGG